MTVMTFDAWWHELRRVYTAAGCIGFLGDQESYRRFWQDGYTPRQAFLEEMTAAAEDSGA